jgi:hypothetical protein
MGGDEQALPDMEPGNPAGNRVHATQADAVHATGADAAGPIAPPLFAGLAEAHDVLHFVSTRQGGVSAAPYDTLNLGFHVGDDPDAVLENRRRLCRAVGISLDALTCARQCHGSTIAVVSARERGRGARDWDSALPQTDALVTDCPDVCVAVLVADCVPVLLLDPERRVVAAVHAGWRGTADRIAERTVTVMRDRLHCDPADILAGLGPAIDGPHYEVGPEVAGAVRRAMGASAASAITALPGGRARLDLAEANRLQLLAAGLRPEAIELSGVSTYLRTDAFYSARASSGRTGRFAVGICLGG